MNCVFLTACAVVYNLLICQSDGAVVKSEFKMDSSKLSPENTHHNAISETIRKRSENNDHEVDYYHDYYYQEQEEPECPEDHFWHIRGLRCVPFDCPGGNQFRNQHTGECLLSRYGMSEGSKIRPSRLLNRQKAPSKFRLPFGLTLKG